MNENEMMLVRWTQQKDADAFDEILERYYDRLFRIAYLISGNYANSEDIIQETFIKYYCSYKELKDCPRFPSWLYRILAGTARRYVKKQRWEEPVGTFSEGGDFDNSNVPLEPTPREEERTAVMTAINRLELKQRMMIVLYYYNQLSIKEISCILGCLRGTAKSRLHTVRKNLEQSLREKGTKVWKTGSWILRQKKFWNSKQIGYSCPLSGEER